jgi:hypothetical protein
LKSKRKKSWLQKVDAFLDGNSWDRTWSQMAKHIETKMAANKTITHIKKRGEALCLIT